jgi:hypothetical protein
MSLYHIKESIRNLKEYFYVYSLEHNSRHGFTSKHRSSEICEDPECSINLRTSFNGCNKRHWFTNYIQVLINQIDSMTEENLLIYVKIILNLIDQTCYGKCRNHPNVISSIKNINIRLLEIDDDYLDWRKKSSIPGFKRRYDGVVSLYANARPRVLELTTIFIGVLEKLDELFNKIHSKYSKITIIPMFNNREFLDSSHIVKLLYYNNTEKYNMWKNEYDEKKKMTSYRLLEYMRLNQQFWSTFVPPHVRAIRRLILLEYTTTRYESQSDLNKLPLEVLIMILKCCGVL